jgi:hypothetical protein
MQIIDLESRLDQLTTENRELQEARVKAEQTALAASNDLESHANIVRHATQAVAERDIQIQERDDTIRELREKVDEFHNEVARLAQENANLTEENQGMASTAKERFTSLQSDHDHAHNQWQDALVAIAALKVQHKAMSDKMEDTVREEIAKATADQEREIEKLRGELEESMEQIKSLQEQLLSAKQANDDFLTIRDEDYFEPACQQLFKHIQQWVMRFSKFSDGVGCRLSSEIKDETIENRLDDTILDGSDVDLLLADRVKRRDVFTSLAVSIIWEYVFTRYLFGLDRAQRQKLKSIEKQLTEIGMNINHNYLRWTKKYAGPQRAVAQWRAITLTWISATESFRAQREQDTEAVVQEVYSTLARLLPPPKHLRQQSLDSLRKVMKLAVDLSIEMRTQKPEYVMLPPLKPKYDVNGDLVEKVYFNAPLMTDRSGDSTNSEELEARQAIVKLVLFPLVVKKGDDNGEGEEEVVVSTAQVVVNKPASGKKVVRVISGPMDIDARVSTSSFVGEPSSPEMVS